MPYTDADAGLPAGPLAMRWHFENGHLVAGWRCEPLPETQESTHAQAMFSGAPARDAAPAYLFRIETGRKVDRPRRIGL